MNEFEQFSAKKAHEEEIKTSRVGGLGGSDAAMVLKIGRNGLQALSNTDVKRLRVMLGLDEPSISEATQPRRLVTLSRITSSNV